MENVNSNQTAKINYSRCLQVLDIFTKGSTQFKPGELDWWGFGKNEKVAIGQSRDDGKYYVKHEWIVPESYEDDPESITGSLFPGQSTRSYRIAANSPDALRQKLAEATS